MRRDELSDEQWRLVADVVQRAAKKTGRPGRGARTLRNGMFWVLCSGASWRDLPERYGPHQTVYERFRSKETAAATGCSRDSR